MIRTICAAIIAAFSLTLLGSGAQAQDVTLISRDGSIELSGTLLSFDGEFYRIDTRFGPLTLDGQGVICRGVGCPNLEDYVARFRFAGSTEIGGALLPALVEAYAARRGLAVLRRMSSDSNFTYVLQDQGAGRVLAEIGFALGSSADGFAALIAGEAEIAMSVREVRPFEVFSAQEAGLGALAAPTQTRILALDALVPIVARGNPVDQIDMEALSSILAGDVTDWPQQAAPILLHGQAQGSGVEQDILDRLLTPAGRIPAAPILRHGSAPEVSDAVARDPLALAVTRYSALGNALPLALGAPCGRVLRPGRQVLKTGDYPFTTPLFLYTGAARLPLFAREFLAFARSPQAQVVIRREGFVDQGRETIPMDAQGERLLNALAVAGKELPLDEVQRMLGRLAGAARLTTSFRFRGGATQLEPQSAANVADLARAIEAGFFDGRQVLFVGFSDGEGDWAANRDISRRRAQSVLDAVRKAAFAADFSRLELSSEGFGEALPIACDDTEWGRAVNRRVEVWLR